MAAEETVNPDPAIRFQSVSKRFKLNAEQSDSILDTLISSFSITRSKQAEGQYLWAVRESSFDIWPGECVGLVGRNGSGKSTMLKLAAGIIRPSTGHIEIRGRLSALLELGAGFHPDLTGRENVSLNASILGLSNAEVAQKYDEIVAFSELSEFINMPVKHYSSGMYMRLGFSVAVHVNPDVLLIDEILAVGDQSFQDKCIDKLHQLRDEGTTVVFVSHNLETVRSLCSRIIWIDSGKPIADGPVDKLLQEYLESYNAQEPDPDVDTVLPRKWGSGEIELTDICILNHEGVETTQFVTGEQLIIEMHYSAKQPVEDPEFILSFFREDTNKPEDLESQLSQPQSGIFSGTGVIRCHIDRLTLTPADYLLSASISDAKDGRVHDHHEKVYSLSVVADPGRKSKGQVDIPATWDSETNEPTSTAEISVIQSTVLDSDQGSS